MNKQTRKQIETIVSNLRTELEKLQQIYDYEVDKFDNIPENLLYSGRAEQMEETIDNLSQCVDDLEIICDTLAEIVNV